jgi:hypothetical protein
MAAISSILAQPLQGVWARIRLPDLVAEEGGLRCIEFRIVSQADPRVDEEVPVIPLHLGNRLRDGLP